MAQGVSATTNLDNSRNFLPAYILFCVSLLSVYNSKSASNRIAPLYLLVFLVSEKLYHHLLYTAATSAQHAPWVWAAQRLWGFLSPKSIQHLHLAGLHKSTCYEYLVICDCLTLVIPHFLHPYFPTENFTVP